MEFSNYSECEEEAKKISSRYKNEDHVVERMEKDFATDFSDIKFHSMPSLGKNAYAKGKDVFFGEGMERSEVISHELVHTMQQRENADTNMITQSAPEGSVQGWGLGEHGLITKLAYRIANGGSNKKDEKNDKKLESIMAGAKFNDVRDYSTAGFVMKYLTHGDEYINQSHHGSLQALHTMNSTGSASGNNAQQLAYAKFCIDVGTNKEIGGQNIQDMSFIDYIKNGDYVLKEMFYPMFIEHSVLKKMENESGGNKGALWEKIEVALDDPKNHSKYANMTVKEFFTGGNKKLDAGMVAQGSLAHLLEDSFSNAHAQRTGNSILESSGIREAVQNQNVAEEFLANPDKILGGATNIMLHQDYNEQFSVGPLGKHEHGDGFEEGKKKTGFWGKIKNFFKRKKKDTKLKTSDDNMLETQGAMQAQMSVAYMFRKMAEGKSDDAYNFVEKVLKVDDNALILDKINQERKGGKDAASLNRLAEQSDAFKGLDFGKHEYSYTKGGRQYEHTFESSYKYFGEDKGWMNHEKDPGTKKLLKEYDALLGDETYNKIFSAGDLADRYGKQADLMIEIFTSDKASKETRARLSSHAMELLTHIASLIKQYDKKDMDRVFKLQGLRGTLVNALNYTFTE